MQGWVWDAADGEFTGDSMTTDGPTRQVTGRTHRAQIYQMKSKVRVLMKDGKACCDEYYVTVRSGTPRLPFSGGSPKETGKFSH